MRRNDEEFKAELLRRCDEYKKVQKKKRRIAASISTSVALLVLSVSGLLMLTMPNGDEAMSVVDASDIYSGGSVDRGSFEDTYNCLAEPSPETAAGIVSVDVNSYPTPGDNVKQYTNSDKIEQIIDCISALEFSVLCGDFEESIGEGYTIAVTNSDESVTTYTFVENRFFRMDDGEWMELESDQAEELKQLIDSLPSD